MMIIRCMTVFYLIVFSVPFFLEGTYKAYMVDYEPIMKSFNRIREEAGDQAWKKVLDKFVS